MAPILALTLVVLLMDALLSSGGFLRLHMPQ
ncbi:hypothetical protein QFZ63_000151 [Streptomyces sp. B3I7]|nr:hypothetical protein [Streptomyces sp. B3I7]